VTDVIKDITVGVCIVILTGLFSWLATQVVWADDFNALATTVYRSEIRELRKEIKKIEAKTDKSSEDLDDLAELEEEKEFVQQQLDKVVDD